VPLETDILNTNRNVLTGLGALIQDLFGTNTVFSGLGCVPTIPASLNVTINPGRVYELALRDPTAYSSLGTDTVNQIMKQGILLTAQVLSLSAPASAGFSQNYLVSANFIEQDINPVVLPYYNAANPAQAFSGPPVGGVSSGTAQNTTRQDTVVLTLTPGIAATTGTQATPATPTGTTPLWVITVANGQTTIVAANIAPVAGSPMVPMGGYLAAIGERFSSIITAAASQTLTVAALGALVNITSTGTTQTLPAASACTNGTTINLSYMQASGSATVARNGTDTFAYGQGSSATSLTLNPGEEVQFVSNGVNGWTSAGQTLSTGVTQPLGTNTTQLATMAALYAGLYQGKGVMQFTSSGSFVVPAGVTAIYLSGCPGGGGGGGCATVGSPNIMSGAGGGGAGQPAIRKKVTVVPGETLTITIGAAGIAGALNTTGGSGGTTSIVGSISGTLLTLTGGSGGLLGLAGTYSSYQAGQSGGAGFPSGSYGQDTGPVGIGAIGGAGASGPFGGGGPGGRGTLIGTTMFPGISAAGYGAGGGGCGGCYPGGNTTITTTPGNTGGAASAGLAIIEW
jgi:hypothetical protein